MGATSKMRPGGQIGAWRSGGHDWSTTRGAPTSLGLQPAQTTATCHHRSLGLQPAQTTAAYHHDKHHRSLGLQPAQTTAARLRERRSSRIATIAFIAARRQSELSSIMTGGCTKRLAASTKLTGCKKWRMPITLFGMRPKMRPITIFGMRPKSVDFWKRPNSVEFWMKNSKSCRKMCRRPGACGGVKDKGRIAASVGQSKRKSGLSPVMDSQRQRADCNQCWIFQEKGRLAACDRVRLQQVSDNRDPAIPSSVGRSVCLLDKNYICEVESRLIAPKTCNA